MSDSTLWWLLAGSTVALELFTGTFYLLMLAVGMAAGALAAHAGLGLVEQLIVAALTGSALVVAWYFVKKRRDGDPSVRSLRSVNLDVGEVLQIDEWNPDGTASVKFRIPNKPALKGVKAHFQWGVVDPAARGIGLAFSDGATVTL